MGTSLITVQQGDEISASQSLFFLGTGSAGDPRSPRRLVWPSAVSPLLAPLVYAIGSGNWVLNPSKTLNLDSEPLPHPHTAVVETLGVTRAVRFERGLGDVVVTEIWEAGAGASMPTSFFRLLYEYLRNAALIPADGPPIVWEPRDRSEKTYEVALLSLSAGGASATGGAGGGDDESRFDVADVRADPRTTGKTADDALSSLSTTPTGLVTTEVRLRMLILGEA
jgi:hypothetical protein